MIAPARSSAVIPPTIVALPARADELRALLIAWCEQNSGSDNFAGLAAMLELLRPAFTALPGAVEAVEAKGAVGVSVVVPTVVTVVVMAGAALDLDDVDVALPLALAFRSC